MCGKEYTCLPRWLPRHARASSTRSPVMNIDIFARRSSDHKRGGHQDQLELNDRAHSLPPVRHRANQPFTIDSPVQELLTDSARRRRGGYPLEIRVVIMNVVAYFCVRLCTRSPWSIPASHAEELVSADGAPPSASQVPGKSTRKRATFTTPNTMLMLTLSWARNLNHIKKISCRSSFIHLTTFKIVLQSSAKHHFERTSDLNPHARVCETP